MRGFAKASAAAVMGATLILAPPAAAGEGIVNGGFDSGTAPWTASGEINFGLIAGGAIIGFDSGLASGSLSQTFTTTADGLFDYAFDLGRGEAACQCNDVVLTFAATLDGVLLADALPVFAGSNPLSTPLLSHDAGSIALDAGDHTLSFAFSRQPTGFGRAPYFLIDSVQGVSTPSGPTAPVGVPEPATWALMIAGFGLAGGALRRRRLQPA